MVFEIWFFEHQKRLAKYLNFQKHQRHKTTKNHELPETHEGNQLLPKDYKLSANMYLKTFNSITFTVSTAPKELREVDMTAKMSKSKKKKLKKRAKRNQALMEETMQHIVEKEKREKSGGGGNVISVNSTGSINGNNDQNGGTGRSPANGEEGEEDSLPDENDKVEEKNGKRPAEDDAKALQIEDRKAEGKKPYF